MPFLLWLSLTASHLLHPFYISMTDINYNDKNKSVEISIRIFTDDFEKTLRKNCDCKVDLTNPQDKAAMERLVVDYIQKNLQIKLNGHGKVLQYHGFQKEEESTWSYFIINNIEKVDKIELTNTILHDYQDDQINMVHIKANGKEQTDKLDGKRSYYVYNR
jgi:hypothetical protein